MGGRNTNIMQADDLNAGIDRAIEDMQKTDDGIGLAQEPQNKTTPRHTGRIPVHKVAKKQVEVPLSRQALTEQPKTKRKYNWEAMRAMYVEGKVIDDETGEREWPTMEDVANHFDRPSAIIRQRAAKERWTIERSVYQGKIRDIRQRDRAKELGKEARDLDSKGLNTAKLGLNLTMARLAEIGRDLSKAQQRKEEMEKLIAQGMPGNLKDLRSAVYYREMEGLAKAAQMFHQLGREALGENVQRVEVSGPEGKPIEHQIDVRAELQRDDPERIAKLLHALQQTNVMQALERSEIIDAETVDDPDEQEG